MKTKEITWDTLKWKDVLITDNGLERMVLDVRNDLVDISYPGNFEEHYSTYHKKELQNFGLTIKQTTPVEKVITKDGRKYQLMEE